MSRALHGVRGLVCPARRGQKEEEEGGGRGRREGEGGRGRARRVLGVLAC
jgi:hypothetical protein